MKAPLLISLVFAAGCAAGKVGVEEDLSHPRDLASAPSDSATAPAADLAPSDGAGATPDDTGPPPPPGGPVRYLPGIRHSPLTSGIVAALVDVLGATTGRQSVFAKIGDSITVDGNYLHCYAGTDIMLDTSSALEPTRAYFQMTLADASKSSFDRTSLAAVVGKTAGWAITGTPTPIDQEVAAINPAFALVQYGTNETDPCCVESFETNITGVVDALLMHNIVPLLSTIPPRGDSTTLNALVPEFNAVIRVVAQRRQIPYFDFWQTLINLPQYGLAGDGVHPQVYVSGSAHGCWLTPAGLTEGTNQHNKIALEALDRAKRYLINAATPDAAPPPLAGSGTWQDPLVVDALPFVDVGDTSKSTTSVANVYSCATQNEGGPEVVYKVTLDAPATLRARVFVEPGVDIDLHWLSAPMASACLLRNDKVLDITAQAGTYYLSADTFVSAGVPKPGPYRLTLVKLN
jgi:hypothetical protein